MIKLETRVASPKVPFQAQIVGKTYDLYSVSKRHDVKRKTLGVMIETLSLPLSPDCRVPLRTAWRVSELVN